MIYIPGPIPIAIHPIFWVFAALLGWLNSGNLLGTAIWIGIIFVSVLVHEFGHALVALSFRQRAQIHLIALGGVTSYEGPKLRFWQQFLIVFNGPFFGLLLFALATFLLRLDWTDHPIWHKTLMSTQIANLFWSLINLLPVMPLDGGQLLRIALEASFGIKGFRASLLVGAVIATLLSLYFFLVQAFLIGAFLFYFAFQGFDAWRKSRYTTRSDREDGETQKLLSLAEAALQKGDKQEAKQLFEEIHSKKREGVLFSAASQYLAFLYAAEGKRREAYELLLPMKKHIAEEIRPLFHQLAAEQKNYSLVAELAGECYQLSPTREVALRNARAFAYLKQAKPAGGWLQTAWQHGGLDMGQILKEEEFSPLKSDPAFREFIDSLY